MAWSGIEPATSRSRVRRANHSATLPLLQVLLRHRRMVSKHRLISSLGLCTKTKEQNKSEKDEKEEKR
ncbi:hypothetical protein ElyMa_006948600, partial [Elysia marginata]